MTWENIILEYCGRTELRAHPFTEETNLSLALAKDLPLSLRIELARRACFALVVVRAFESSSKACFFLLLMFLKPCSSSGEIELTENDLRMGRNSSAPTSAGTCNSALGMGTATARFLDRSSDLSPSNSSSEVPGMRSICRPVV